MEPSPTSDRPIAGSPSRPRPDPEFAPDPFPAAAFPPGFDPVDHQRLVVNPFLAVAGLIGWAWMTWRCFLTSFPPAALGPSLLLLWLPFLVQCHCFDCGSTEAFPRWRRHACSRVVHRGRVPTRRGWLAWPSARSQLIVWGYLLGAAGLLIVVVLLAASRF